MRKTNAEGQGMPPHRGMAAQTGTCESLRVQGNQGITRGCTFYIAQGVLQIGAGIAKKGCFWMRTNEITWEDIRVRINMTA